MYHSGRTTVSSKRIPKRNMRGLDLPFVGRGQFRSRFMQSRGLGDSVILDTPSPGAIVLPPSDQQVQDSLPSILNIPPTGGANSSSGSGFWSSLIKAITPTPGSASGIIAQTYPRPVVPSLSVGGQLQALTGLSPTILLGGAGLIAMLAIVKSGGRKRR